ncbi:tetratricopeptide repeat protein [Erythrobacter sp. JK5]|uniref:tetratricopeptide repeat protein n=1 Tax=Erythrobacter sp. JK5 TaxID=2829500 RepID=UPI001BA9F1F4|nr:tetratricopeptide repeat protein [Erythrobacter sp. JK5]QUL38980.1 tetratricopeptide repeat protein [Erythrobacter sp. JK5]
MFYAATTSFKALSAGVLLAIASPALAGGEVQPQGFEAAIGRAKSLMMADSAAALELARQAKSLVRNENGAAAKDRLTAQWLEGEALMRLNRGDEAASAIESALALASKEFQEDKIHADLLRSAASLKARAGKFGEARSFFSMAYDRYERLGDGRSQAIVLQNIGSLYSHARDFEQVLHHYRKAEEVYSGDVALSLSAHNNIGNALKELGRFEEAEAEMTAALTLAGKMGSPMLEARILTNLASTQYLRGADQEAEQTANRAMAIADEHAADWTPFIHGVLAQIKLGQDNLDDAANHIALTFANQTLNQTNALFRDFHITASEIFARTGNAELAAMHAAALERIDGKAKELRL